MDVQVANPVVGRPVPRSPPPFLTRFVGRRRDLAALQQQISSHRLVTLVGMGGSGKTRLAAEVVRRPMDGGSSVAWVDLASLTDGHRLAYAVAEVLGLEAGASSEPDEVTSRTIGNSALLLVLDNCEEIAADCAAYVEALLAACPRVTVLATSRRPLHANGETVVHLPPMAVHPPDPGGWSEAAELFYDRAGAVLPAYPMLGGESQAVEALVTRVDGLPLAIELAASWIRVLSARELLVEIDRNAEALASCAPHLSGRHRSMQAVLDSSWRWLDADERRVLNGLSVFSGGFTREAAEAVCGAGLGSLASLAERSLIRRVHHPHGGSRFELHELVRMYAQAQLTSSGPDELDAVRRRHFDFFLPLAEGQDGDGFTPSEPDWNHPLHIEQANLEAALGWAMGRGDAERAVRLVNPLDAFWAFATPPLPLRRERAAAVVAMPGSLSPAAVLARARVLEALAYLTSPDDLDRAERHFEDSRTLHTELLHQAGVASCLRGIAWIRVGRGDVTTGQHCSAQSLAICRVVGDVLGEAWSLYQLGESAFVGEDFAAAERHTVDARRVFDEAGGHYGVYSCDVNLADIHRRQGRAAEALVVYHQALLAQQNRHYRTGGEAVLDGIAQIAATRSFHTDAARLLGAGASWRQLFADYRTAYYQAAYDQAVADSRRHLTGCAWQDAFDAGRNLTAEAAMQLAAKSIAELSADLAVAPVVLTDRETGILRMVAAGLRDNEIADELVLSPRTVHAHLRSIYAKLGVSSRTGAVHAAQGRLIRTRI